MEGNISEIIDFWIYWNRLVKLKYPSDKPNNWMATWTHWNETSLLKKYEGKVFDFPINISKKNKREQKEETKNRISNINDINLQEEVKEILEWQIWSLQIDLDKNLQCLSWSRTFWVDCLINWIYRKSDCPNWREELNLHRIRPNKELRKFIEAWESNYLKSNKILCDKHNEECTFIWETCKDLIWKTWTRNQNHRNHIILIESETSKCLKEWRLPHISHREFALDERQYNINKIEWMEQMNDNIFDKVFKAIDWSINSLKNEYNKEKIIRRIIKDKLFNQESVKDLTVKELQKQFDEANIKGFKKQMIKSDKESNDIRENVNKSAETYFKEIRMFPLFRVPDPIEYDFSFELSHLHQNVDEIILINDKEENFKIFLKLKDMTIYVKFSEIETARNWKLELKDNELWTLSENNIKAFKPHKNQIYLGKLNININKEIEVKDITLNFWFLEWFLLIGGSGTNIANAKQYILNWLNQSINKDLSCYKLKEKGTLYCSIITNDNKESDNDYIASEDISNSQSEMPESEEEEESEEESIYEDESLYEDDSIEEEESEDEEMA